MEISPLSHQVQPSDLPLEQLAKNQHLNEEQKVGELSRQFEAVLLRQILRDVQKTVIKSNLTPQSAGHEMYQDMVTTQLADGISRSGSFGFAHSLQQELTHQVLNQKKSKEGEVEN
jgi:Rod binding domain-containing protein